MGSSLESAPPEPGVERGVAPAGAISSALSAVTAAVSGIAPHVLHHVGPLAGAAFLAGAGGTVLFGVAGYAVSIPMLLRLRRRFGTWLAPGIASVIFVAVYLVSSLAIGPALTGAGADGSPDGTPIPSDHEDHHGGEGRTRFDIAGLAAEPASPLDMVTARG